MVKRILAVAVTSVVLTLPAIGSASAGQPPCPGGSGVDTDPVDVCLKNGRKL